MVSSSVVVPRDCGYGPQGAKWVGAMGIGDTANHLISSQSSQYGTGRPSRVGGCARVPGRQGPGRPGGPKPGNARSTCALPWSKDSRWEWLSLPSLAIQLVPWTDKWQCWGAVTETVKVIPGIEWNRISAQVGFSLHKVPHQPWILHTPPLLSPSSVSNLRLAFNLDFRA